MNSWDEDEKWKQYLLNLTFPENTDIQPLIVIYKLKYYNQNVEKLPDLLTSYVIQPKSKHSATVIFLHGLGDVGKSWGEAFEPIQQEYFPHVKFIFPNA